MSKTLFDKIWEQHVIKTCSDGTDLLFVDRHLIHEVTSPQAFSALSAAQRHVKHPELTISVEDHLVSTDADRVGASFSSGQALVARARSNALSSRIPHYDISHANHGIVHVIAAEQGIVLPGMTVVCGDSHTCTLGALGAVAFGIGTSSVEHVLATQTLRQKKPRNMLVCINGTPGPQVSAKDVILKLCGELTSSGATGHAIEFSGSFVRGLDMDGRLTLCNMSIEVGARICLIAPDMRTIHYVQDVASQKGECVDPALLRVMKDQHSDTRAQFEKSATLDIDRLAPQITWGTSPDQVIDIDATIDANQNERDQSSLDYMRLTRGSRLLGQRIDQVFIGSCTNGRLADLRAAADIVRGLRVERHVKARVVPGSKMVKRAAEAEGLHEAFLDAGFSWGEPGCSMCCSINGEFVSPGARCISTSNRNFIGRQGPGALTHLASPQVAAASALAGEIADPRAVSP